MAIITYLKINSVSLKSASIQYKVVLQQGQDLIDGGNDLRYESESYIETIGGKILQRDDIQLSQDKQCKQFVGTVTYKQKQDKATTNSQDGGSWLFPQADQVISVTVSQQTTTCYDIGYTIGGTITNAGTFGSAAGYSQTGFQVSAAKTLVTVVKRVNSVPANWAATQAEKVGKVNNAILFDFPIGSLKFQGLDVPPYPIAGTASNQLITYRYQYSAPNESFTINGITIPGKKGWEVYDFKKQPDEYGNKVTVDYQILYPYVQDNINCIGGSGQLFPQPL